MAGHNECVATIVAGARQHQCSRFAGGQEFLSRNFSGSQTGFFHELWPSGQGGRKLLDLPDLGSEINGTGIIML
jgi:hypothetical protein